MYSYNVVFVYSNIQIKKGDKYPDVCAVHDFDKGDYVVLVYAEYSTGNSFGRDPHKHQEPIGLFLDIKSANELKKHILKQVEDREDGYDIKTSDGQVFKCEFAPWNGHFEILEEVCIEIIEFS